MPDGPIGRMLHSELPRIREGDIVQYRTRPCPTPDEGADIDLYSNFERERRARPLWRPAIVLRVWSSEWNPAVNLRVLADSDGTFDRFRPSVPHTSRAEDGDFAWRRRDA